MILDMNIQLSGIDEEFLEELDELIEDTRVEYFIINPDTKEELLDTQAICKECERFRYSIPVEFLDIKDKSCVAMQIKKKEDLKNITDLPLVIDSKNLTEAFIKELNKTTIKGIVLNATEQDTLLNNFIFTVSKNSLSQWTQKGIKNLDYTKLALQSDYPEQTYDQFVDEMLKEISDLTFRAEQIIAAGGTRTLLQTFKLL